MEHVLLLLIMVVLIICSGLISGSEVAFFSLGPAQMQELEESETNYGNKALSLLEKPKRLLATILIANNFVNVAIVMVSAYFMNSFIDFGNHHLLEFTVQVVVVTFILLLFGEVLPKVFATKKATVIIKLMAIPLVVLSFLFKGFSSLLVSSTSFIDRKFKKKGHNVSVSDLSNALELTSDINEEEEQKILEGIVKFGDTTVRQIMIPRTEIFSIDYENSFEEVMKYVLDAGFSRLPVYQETNDNIIGILYIKDLIPHFKNTNYDWHQILRKPFFVPESKKLDDLLKDFQHRKVHLAIVADEYGGTKGIITLEDILEEIVGDISDEFDDENIVYSKLDDNNYIFDGKVMLSDLYKVLDIDGNDFEKEKDSADTLAGFLIEQNGKIPRVKEKIKFNNYLFTIESADNRKIKRIKLTIENEAE